MKHRLPENLLILRKIKGKSQKEIANEIANRFTITINQRSYSGYERGFCEPHIVSLKAMADYHDITMNDLCFKVLTI